MEIIMTILFIPFMVFGLLYVAATLASVFSDIEFKKLLNMELEDSLATRVVLLSLMVVMVAILIGSAFMDEPNKTFLVIMSIPMYISIGGAWYWFYESYKKDVHKLFVK